MPDAAGDGGEDLSGVDDWVTVNKQRVRGAGAGRHCAGGAGRGSTVVDCRLGRSSGYQPAPSRPSRGIDDRTVHVGTLPYHVTEGALRTALSQVGPIEKLTIDRDDQGRRHPVAFAVFKSAFSAETICRTGVLRVGGDRCPVTPYIRGRSAPRESRDFQTSSQESAAARKVIQDFIARHEVSTSASIRLMQVDPRMALRVINSLENGSGCYSQAVLMSALSKVTSATPLSKAMETNIRKFAESSGLPPDVVHKLEGVLLVAGLDEINYVLDQGEAWARRMKSKKQPEKFLVCVVRGFQRRRTAQEIKAFCEEFGFDGSTEMDLCSLSPDTGRRLMESWNRGCFGWDRDKLLVLVAQRLKESNAREEERRHRQLHTIVDHERIIQEWSDDEALASDEDEEAVSDGGGREDATQRPLSVGEAGRTPAAFAVDANWDTGEEDGGKAGPSVAAAERFIMHSTVEGNGSQTSVPRRQRREPKPTHFILCVDTSGSMSTKDCKESNGWLTTRLQAVMNTCQQFITQSMLCKDDRYSFLTFNEMAALHFSCERAFDAAGMAGELKLTAERQTFYGMGIKAIEAAIRRDDHNLPSHVVFLSDGEPTDPETYIHDLHHLRRKRSGGSLKIYTVGFGESGKVKAGECDFAYLQQLASIGGGHFQRCGASLESLTGAFSAVTSTISHSRRSSRDSRGSGSRGKSSSTTRADGGSAAGAAAVAGASELPFVTICEADGEEDGSEVSADDPPAEAAQDVKVTASVPSRVEFELPVQEQIYKDMGCKDLWDSFKAVQATFEFNGNFFEKRMALERVHLRRKPFMQGGMRLVYGMLLEKGPRPEDFSEHMCAKRLFRDLKHGDTGFAAHSAFCRSSAVARYYARWFRRKLKKEGVLAEFRFLPTYLYSPDVGESAGFHFCGEQYMTGHFVKLNSNAGFVNEHEYSEHSMVAQAFSHFTFHHSHAKLLVVDLQGVCHAEGPTLHFYLTDPQVHSRGGLDRFGPGDLGNQGVRAFFQKHRCNALCKRLGLKRELDLCEHTHAVKMPGVKGLISWFLGSRSGYGDMKESSAEFFRTVRSKFRVSTMNIPTEVYAHWQDITIWSTIKGGAKAVEALEQRLELYYERYVTKIVVPEKASRWPAETWEEKLRAWRDETNTPIIPWPPNWTDEAACLKEVWVFADSVIFANGAADDFSRLACQRIREAMAVAASDAEEPAAAESPCGGESRPEAGGSASAELAGPSGAVSAASGGATWSVYQDPEKNLKYFYRDEKTWFYENDSKWPQYFDDSKRPWRYNITTGEWFYEPAA